MQEIVNLLQNNRIFTPLFARLSELAGALTMVHIIYLAVITLGFRFCWSIVGYDWAPLIAELGVSGVLYLAAIGLASRFCWRMIELYWDEKDAASKARQRALGKEMVPGTANQF